MKKILISVAVVLLILPAWVAAQEIIYDVPIQVSPDSLDCENPFVVFNGKEHGVLYYMDRPDDDFGLFFQRLDADCKLIGPPTKVLDYEGFITPYGFFSEVEPLAGVWDGEAYLFLASEDNLDRYYLLRISPEGELIKKRIVAKDPFMDVSGEVRFYLFVIGDRMFFFFNLSGKNWSRPYLMEFDRQLTGEVSVKMLPIGKSKIRVLLGVAHDTDKFVLLLADGIAADDWEYLKVSIAHIDFNGKVIKPPAAISYLARIPAKKTAPAGGQEFYEVMELSGPEYVGDGFIITASRLIEVLDAPPAGFQLPYIHNLFKFDEDGNLIGDPLNLGDSHWLYDLRRSVLCGNHVAFVAQRWHYYPDEAFVVLAGKKGKHIGNAYFEEVDEYHQAEVSETCLAYTGFAGTIVYTQDRGFFFPTGITDRTDPIYCNQYKMPKFTKPGFLFFQAGTAEPVKNHRLVMWSIVAGGNVTLTGPDFEMTDLPPVWSYLVDTKGQTTKLKLSFTTEDGKTKKKKLVIEP